MSAQLTVNQVDENMEEDVEMNVDIPSETEEKFDAAPLEVEEMVDEERFGDEEGEIEKTVEIEKEEKTESEPNEDSKELTADENLQEELPNEEVSEKKDKAEDNPKSMEMDISPMQGVLDVTLFKTPHLTATQSTAQNKERITLIFTASGTLDLGLLKSTYIIFHLPNEISSVMTKENMSASYSVPFLLGIPISGDFRNEDIVIDGNQVSMNFRSLLSLNLLLGEYCFTLNIDLDEIPVSNSPEYTFYSQATRQLVDLALLSGEPVATATLPAPHLPDMPNVEPIYETDTKITGTAPAGFTVIATVNGVSYEAIANESDRFSIPISPIARGTPVTVRVQCSHGYLSDNMRLTVLKIPDAPLLQPIYSNDETIFGSGEPNMRIHLLVGEVTYEGVTDSEGNFAVLILAQAAGTPIIATVTDKNGRTSDKTYATVLEAMLTFYHVPDTLAFETTKITTEPKIIKRQNPDWKITVMDTRGKGSKWRVTAHINEPLTLLENPSNELPDSLVFIDHFKNKISLSSDAISVFEGETIERITNVTFKEDEGPLLYVTPSNAFLGEYATEITWTLIDAP